MKRLPAIGAAVAGLLLASTGQAGPAIHEVMVSGEVDEAPLDETLRLVFRELEVPFVLIEDDVPDATVSFSLDGVPLDEVLDALLPPHGLRWEVTDQVVLVRANELPEVRALREEVSALRASVEALSDGERLGSRLVETVLLRSDEGHTLGEISVTLLGITGDGAHIKITAPERSNFSPIVELVRGQRQMEHGVFLEVLDLDESAQTVRLRIEVPETLTEEDWPTLFL